MPRSFNLEHKSSHLTTNIIKALSLLTPIRANGPVQTGVADVNKQIMSHNIFQQIRRFSRYTYMAEYTS